MVNEMSREDDLRLQQGIFDFQRALVSNSALTDDSFKNSQDRAQHAFFDMIGLLRPWEGTTAEERKEQETNDLTEGFREAFGGDPSDPVWQAAYEKELAEWTRHQETTQHVETDEERVARRQQELEAERIQRQQEALARRNKQGRTWHFQGSNPIR